METFSSCRFRKPTPSLPLPSGKLGQESRVLVNFEGKTNVQSCCRTQINHSALLHIQGGSNVRTGTWMGCLSCWTLSWQIPCTFSLSPKQALSPRELQALLAVVHGYLLLDNILQLWPSLGSVHGSRWPLPFNPSCSWQLIYKPALEWTSDQDQGYHRVASWPSEIRCLLIHKQVGNLYTIKNSSAWLEPLVPARFKATHILSLEIQYLD